MAEQQVEQPKPFDAFAHIKASNEADEARRQGKQPPTPAKPAEPAVAKPTEPVESEGTRDGQHLATKSQRRMLTLAQKEASEERGKRLALESLIEKGVITPAAAAKVSDAPKEPEEPKRASYPDDAAFYKAISKYYGDKAAKDAVATVEEKQAQADVAAKVQRDYEAADAKVKTDILERFEDWAEVSKAAMEAAEKRMDESEDGKDPLTIGRPETQTFNQMFHLSKQKAALMYHFAKNPDALGDFLGMEDGSIDQILAFKELEGELKVLYPKKQAKPAETAADRDAKKAKPSEAVTVKGGEAVSGTPEMVLADGKTLNPAWKTWRNQQDGRRA